MESTENVVNQGQSDILLSEYLTTVDQLIARSRGFLLKLRGRPTYLNPNNQQVLATIPKDIVDLLSKQGIRPPYVIDWTVARQKDTLRVILDHIETLEPE
jgi:hypothetical protein